MPTIQQYESVSLSQTRALIQVSRQLCSQITEDITIIDKLIAMTRQHVAEVLRTLANADEQTKQR